jgi:hypothetical protein
LRQLSVSARGRCFSARMLFQRAAAVLARGRCFSARMRMKNV